MNEATASKTKTRAKKETEKTEPVFRFFLSDGREVKSLDGLVVPVTEKTETAYRMLADSD